MHKGGIMQIKDKNNFEINILIDTNAMNNLHLYLDICLKIGIEPDQDDFNKIKKIICDKLHVSEQEKVIQFTEVEKGYKLYNYLKKANQLDGNKRCKFFFSRLSQVELNHILLEKKYHSDLADCQVPYRIRKDNIFKRNTDYVNYLKDIYTTGVIQHNKEINELITEKEIDYLIFEDYFRNSMEDTLLVITDVVNKYLHLQSNDLLLYCLAIFGKINYIYSHDNEFKNLCNSLGTDGKCKEYREIIKEELNSTGLEQFLEDEDGNINVIFPEVIKGNISVLEE